MSISIHPYCPEWKSQFESLREHLTIYLKNEFVGIEHVGSTSVPGMSAKPVIDLDIVIKSDLTVMKKVIEQLEGLDYLHRGYMGISGREAFKQISDKTPLSSSGKKWPKHHLYVCTEDSLALKNHLTLKKHLLDHPEKVIEYSQLKKDLAKKFPNDIDAYVDGKTDFIVNILKKEGISDSEARLIEDENRLN